MSVSGKASATRIYGSTAGIQSVMDPKAVARMNDPDFEAKSEYRGPAARLPVVNSAPQANGDQLPRFMRAYVNPTHATSKDLSTLVSRHTTFGGLAILSLLSDKEANDFYNEFVNLLSDAHDVNQQGLAEAVLLGFGIQYFELMLAYGYTPFKRDQFGRGYSPFIECMQQLLAREDYPHIRNGLNIIQTTFTVPEKLRLPTFKVLQRQARDHIYTEFNFKGVMIHTKLLTRKEVQPDSQAENELRTLYVEGFKGHADDVEEGFKFEIGDQPGQEKIYEIIYATKDGTREQVPIGYNVFAMVNLKDEPSRSFVYWIASYINDKHRNNGIIPYLGFRIGFALQELFPEKIIGIFFNSISLFSYMFPCRNTVHGPKYKTEDKVKLWKKLAKVMDEDFVLDPSGIAHIDNDTHITVEGENVDGVNPAATAVLARFQWNVLRKWDVHRGVFVYSEVSDEHWEELSLATAKKLGINFRAEVAEFAPLLREFLAAHKLLELVGPRPVSDVRIARNPVAATDRVMAGAPVTREAAIHTRKAAAQFFDNMVTVNDACGKARELVNIVPKKARL